MNKTAIKNFAIWARKELIEKSTQRAKIYGIEKDKEMKDMDTALNGQVLTKNGKDARKVLIEKIKKDGFDQIIEEVAYTWFNRFIALRFMEVNGYLPSHIRVFSSENNEFQPQILSEAIHIELNGLDKSKVLDFYNDGNKEEELFSYLLITQCNALNQVLPGVFQKLNDYTELLLPDGLLREGSVIDLMIKDIPEEDWKEQVQIIGWLYQYYISEQKDEVFSRPKSQKIQKEDIPAATQLFTPDWIVRYMVENSLGRLWLQGHPNEELKTNWKYYLEEAEQEKEVEEKLEEIRQEYAEIKPVDIKCIDPCIGSGHIGVYLFDVLIQIYESQGYKSRDAVRLILENNIYGLDIDERARQLAYFSLMMKAREYDRRFLTRDYIPQPKVYTIEESNYFNTENGRRALDYFINGDKNLREAIESIIEDMEDAKEYGSIAIVKPIEFKALYQRFDEIREEVFINIDGLAVLGQLLPLVELAEVLSSKYDVVVTNPPYMGSSGMNPTLLKYVNKNYKDSKTDLFAVFMERALKITKDIGFVSLITMESWMFLSSYEKLRKKLLKNTTIINMTHMPYLGKGGTSLGINFGTSALIISKKNIESYRAIYNYIRYYETNKNGVPLSFPIENERYSIVSQSNFEKISGVPIAYWATDNIIKSFEKATQMDTCLDVRQGLATGKNAEYLRQWFEVDKNFIKTDITSINEYFQVLEKNNFKYVFYNKGGPRRQWYGNYDYVIKFDEKNYNELKNRGNHLPSRDYYFKKAITWGLIGTAGFSIRYRLAGEIGRAHV